MIRTNRNSEETCEGWQEIADYFNRTTRWAQKHELELPVARLPGGRPIMNKAKAAQYLDSLHVKRVG